MREKKFKHYLIRQTQIAPGQRVLDLGCGTATLTIMIKQAQPGADVVGLDGDPNVLAIGRAKARQIGVDITLDEGMAFQLPYPEASFDRVLSSLVFHHLTYEDKKRALRESWRVLKSGGEIHLVDFGKPHTAWGRLIAPLIGRAERADDNIQGRLPDIFREAGFEQVIEAARFATVFGTLSAYQGLKPV
jgi:ubiquinone/menaquinone biosynthesis C-methylase UbiE